jgi:hypothetical protein
VEYCGSNSGVSAVFVICSRAWTDGDGWAWRKRWKRLWKSPSIVRRPVGRTDLRGLPSLLSSPLYNTIHFLSLFVWKRRPPTCIHEPRIPVICRCHARIDTKSGSVVQDSYAGRERHGRFVGFACEEYSQSSLSKRRMADGRVCLHFSRSGMGSSISEGLGGCDSGCWDSVPTWPCGMVWPATGHSGRSISIVPRVYEGDALFVCR